MPETMEQWIARVAPTMTADQWRTAEKIATRSGWDPACGEWLAWVQRTAPPRAHGGLPPWGLTLAQALLDHRAAGQPVVVTETTRVEHEHGTTTTYRVCYRGPSLGAALANLAANDTPSPDLDVPPPEPLWDGEAGGVDDEHGEDGRF